MLVQKYGSSLGSPIWSFTFDYAYTNESKSFDIAVNSNGEAFVVGWSKQPIQNYYIWKFDAGGSLVTQTGQYGDEDGNICRSVAIDSADYVYTLGHLSYSSRGSDIFIAKFDASMSSSPWGRTYNSPGNGNDYGYEVAVDADGNVYAAGLSEQSPGNYDFILIKYDSDGNEKWVRTYDSPGGSDERNIFLTLDADGNPYISGVSMRTDEFREWSPSAIPRPETSSGWNAMKVPSAATTMPAASKSTATGMFTSSLRRTDT